MSDRTPEDRRDGEDGRRLGLRISIGAVVGAVAIATVCGLALLPAPTVTAQPQSVTVAPESGIQTIACPGPIARLSDDSGAGATDISTVGGIGVAQGTTPMGIRVDRGALEQPDDAGRPALSEPFVLTAPAEAEGRRAVLAAAQTEQNSSDDLVGFSATACAEPALDSWIVAGATTTGRTSLLFLSNPTDVPATVNLTIFAEQGLVDAPGARGILVPARAQRMLSLAGLVPDAASPVVHVQSTGGAVAAWIQQSVVRGLQDGGFDLVAAVGQPATTQVIPGVEIAATTSIAERLGQPGNEDLQVALRFFVPGTEATALSVTAKSESIGVPDFTVNLGAAGGAVTDSVLRDIPDGTYTLTVRADHPVLVAARTSLVSGTAVDFSWNQSVAPQTSPFVITAPAGPSPRLHLYNPGSADVSVRVRTAQGETADLAVPAGTAVGVPLAAQVYEATPSGPVVASVGYLSGGLVSGFVLAPAAGLDGPVTVYPQ